MIGERRGMTLGVVLLVILLLATLGLTLGAAVFQWRLLSDRLENAEIARDAARSVVTMAMGHLYQDVTYGAARTSAQTLRVDGVPEGAQGLLTFHTATAQAEGVPSSTNNLEGLSVAQSAGRSLPAHSAHLVGVGRYRGVERRVEAVVALPASPYALAANAPIRALGGMKIAALKALPDGPPAPEDLVGCSLLCNAGGEEAVFLSQGSDIHGDVKAVGQVKRDPTAPADSITIRGQVQHVEPVPVPEVTITQYDPQDRMTCANLSQSEYSDPKDLNGVWRRDGNLNLQGGLHLDGGFLYVKGDLTVGEPGLSGHGIVVCTGQVRVSGKASLEASEGVALLAGKDIELTGGSAEGAYFQGMVYTDGTLRCSRVTVVGPTIVKGTDTMVMDQSRLFVPQPVAMTGEWTAGGGAGAAYSGPTRQAYYLANGAWRLESDPAAAGWQNAAVFEKMRGGGFRKWTFTASGRPRLDSVPDLQGELEGMLPNQEALTQAMSAVSGLSKQEDPEPPPAPPRNPGGTASIVIKPSEFWRNEQRLRPVLWLEP